MKLVFKQKKLEVGNMVLKEEFEELKERLKKKFKGKNKDFCIQDSKKVHDGWYTTVHFGGYIFLRLHTSPKIGERYRVIKTP